MAVTCHLLHVGKDRRRGRMEGFWEELEKLGWMLWTRKGAKWKKQPRLLPSRLTPDLPLRILGDCQVSGQDAACAVYHQLFLSLSVIFGGGEAWALMLGLSPAALLSLPSGVLGVPLHRPFEPAPPS